MIFISFISGFHSGFFFWINFLSLILPVEVRILPTDKVVADLDLLNTYTSLTLPLIASAMATSKKIKPYQRFDSPMCSTWIKTQNCP